MLKAKILHLAFRYGLQVSRLTIRTHILARKLCVRVCLEGEGRKKYKLAEKGQNPKIYQDLDFVCLACRQRGRRKDAICLTGSWEEINYLYVQLKSPVVLGNEPFNL